MLQENLYFSVESGSLEFIGADSSSDSESDLN